MQGSNFQGCTMKTVNGLDAILASRTAYAWPTVLADKFAERLRKLVGCVRARPRQLRVFCRSRF